MNVAWIGPMLMLLGSVQAGLPEVFEGTQWLRDPRMEGHAPVDIYHRESTPFPAPESPQNIHMLLRREVVLNTTPESAFLAITGDDYYHFYINGHPVVQGPEPGYPFAHPFYWLDVTEFLDAGANCLAAHVYYQGLINRVWNSGDNRAGFMLALEVRYADGSQARFVTDGDWKCHPLDAFPTGRTFGYKTQFAEDIDMRAIPRGWRERGFDDSTWGTPLSGFQDHVFVLQATPPLQITRYEPKIVKKKAEGNYFYDFGTEIVGRTMIRVQGEPGHTIIVRHGEELSGPETVRFDMRANCVYEEHPVLSGEEDLIEFFDYRAFRYMEILEAPSEPELWVEVQHHPFDPTRVSFASSLKPLEGIWSICQNGVQMGSQGGFLDCPSREKGAYLGDALITARSHLWLTADPSLTRKTIIDFSHSRRIHSALMAVAPGSFMQEIAEYSLQFPLLVDHYYRHSGDAAFTAEVVTTVFPGIFSYFAGFENEAGLIEKFPKSEKWTVIDWPAGLRDDYDYDYALEHANTVLNAFYYGALRTTAALLEDLGRDGAAYDARADRVAQAFAAHLANPDTGLYVDAAGSEHSSLHANAIPLFFGLTAGADKARIIDHIREKRLSCGVYIASYVIEACFRNGAEDLGFDLLTSDDTHSWQEMLRHGATTCMEVWGPDQKRNTSWCHPWSSSPIYLLTEYVLGLSPAEPGWKSLRVAPVLIPDLPEIALTVPIPGGQITARYSPETGYAVTVPDGLPVLAEAPQGVPLTVKKMHSYARPVLSPEDLDLLRTAGWTDRVGHGLGVWVDVNRQMFYLIQGLEPVWQARCSTAEAGTGQEVNSNQTPLGWHRVSEKIGENAPWGQVFVSKAAKRQVWKPGDDTEEDLVLTRILVLDGEEPGLNKGRNEDGKVVDSRERYIYIHGTNAEARIGAPASHGCIRLLNDDVITAFEKIPIGTPMLITERK